MGGFSLFSGSDPPYSCNLPGITRNLLKEFPQSPIPAVPVIRGLWEPGPERREGMAIRPLAFGARFREKGRTVKVYKGDRNTKPYVVEVHRDGKKGTRSEHASLASAVQDFARAWRGRLH